MMRKNALKAHTPVVAIMGFNVRQSERHPAPTGMQIGFGCMAVLTQTIFASPYLFGDGLGQHCIGHGRSLEARGVVL